MNIPRSHSDILDKSGFAHMATIGPDGEPQCNPVWYDHEGDVVKVSLTTTRQKYRNIQKENRVALSIADPDNPYRYLEIRGQVESIEDDPDKVLIDRLAQKYLGEERYPWNQPGDERVIVRIRPERTSTMG